MNFVSVLFKLETIVDHISVWQYYSNHLCHWFWYTHLNTHTITIIAGVIPILAPIIKLLVHLSLYIYTKDFPQLLQGKLLFDIELFVSMLRNWELLIELIVKVFFRSCWNVCAFFVNLIFLVLETELFNFVFLVWDSKRYVESWLDRLRMEVREKQRNRKVTRKAKKVGQDKKKQNRKYRMMGEGSCQCCCALNGCARQRVA